MSFVIKRHPQFKGEHPSAMNIRVSSGIAYCTMTFRVCPSRYIIQLEMNLADRRVQEVSFMEQSL